LNWFGNSKLWLLFVMFNRALTWNLVGGKWRGGEGRKAHPSWFWLPLNIGEIFRRISFENLKLFTKISLHKMQYRKFKGYNKIVILFLYWIFSLVSETRCDFLPFVWAKQSLNDIHQYDYWPVLIVPCPPCRKNNSLLLF